jgi:hypothetical protein
MRSMVEGAAALEMIYGTRAPSTILHSLSLAPDGPPSPLSRGRMMQAYPVLMRVTCWNFTRGWNSRFPKLSSLFY